MLLVVSRQLFFKSILLLLFLILLIQYFFLYPFYHVPRLNSASNSLFYFATTNNNEQQLSRNYEYGSADGLFTTVVGAGDYGTNTSGAAAAIAIAQEHLDPDLGEFIDSSISLTIRNHSKIYSFNNKNDTANQTCASLRKLRGFIKVDLKPPSLYDMGLKHPDVGLGGRFVPNCSHTEKVAIIVPFRDREEHLRTFLYNIIPLLKRQLIEYNIFVVEQGGTDPFNRAMLFNVGFNESLKRDNFTCFIFHDVDLIPENDKNIYDCPKSPRHMSVAVDSLRYRLPYRTIFGGISAIRTDHFKLLNGFSNRYWGWGAEDDDMANRIAYHGLYISRYSFAVARYKMLRHKHQKVNFNRYKILHKSKQRFTTDGLSSLKYNVEEIVLNKLFTLFKVKLPRT